MKNTPLTLEFGLVRLPISADGLLHAPTALAQLGLAQLDLAQLGLAQLDLAQLDLAQVGLEQANFLALVKTHKLANQTRDFGIGPEATLSLPEFVQLAFASQTTEAKRWRKRAADLLVKVMQGDVRLAAQIVERNPNPEERRWLAARLESTNARRELMSTVARHGGEGPVFGQLGSISNQSVLGADSATIRRERGVKQTRDGLNSTELMRLSYLDSATNKAIQEIGVQGNQDILRLHQHMAQRERLGWKTPNSSQAG